MSQRRVPVSLFYAYAHEDETLRDELEKHLSLLRRQGMISTWSDQRIVPGTDWLQEINAHLSRKGCSHSSPYQPGLSRF